MLASINLFPIGKGASMSAFVAAAVKEIDKSGLDYHLTDMGTIVEGEWGPVMKLVDRMRRKMLTDAGRVYLTIAIDDRLPNTKRLGTKSARVESLLSRKRKK